MGRIMVESPTQTTATDATEQAIVRLAGTLRKNSVLIGAWLSHDADTACHAQMQMLPSDSTFTTPVDSARGINLAEGWLRNHNPGTSTAILGGTLTASLHAVVPPEGIPLVDGSGNSENWLLIGTMMNLSGVSVTWVLRALLEVP